MPLNPSFSASESLADPSVITLLDTSTGTDNTITTRQVAIRLANGNWLTTNGQFTTATFIDWPYTDISITLNILKQSTAADITVVWMAGTTPVVSFTSTFCFNLYDYLFALQVLQGNTSAPQQVQDNAYYTNLIQFIVNLFNEENAISKGADLFSSQQAMNQNLVFINKESFFF